MAKFQVKNPISQIVDRYHSSTVDPNLDEIFIANLPKQWSRDDIYNLLSRSPKKDSKYEIYKKNKLFAKGLMNICHFKCPKDGESSETNRGYAFIVGHKSEIAKLLENQGKTMETRFRYKDFTKNDKNKLYSLDIQRIDEVKRARAEYAELQKYVSSQEGRQKVADFLKNYSPPQDFDYDSGSNSGSSFGSGSCFKSEFNSRSVSRSENRAESDSVFLEVEGLKKEHEKERNAPVLVPCRVLKTSKNQNKYPGSRLKKKTNNVTDGESSDDDKNNENNNRTSHWDDWNPNQDSGAFYEKFSD